MASIYQRGTVWRAMVRRRGQSLTATFDTEREAQEWADRHEARVMNGTTAAEVKANPSGWTVADLMDKYAREVSPKHASFRWEVYTLAKLGASIPFAAADFNTPMAAKWRDERLRQVSRATVIREMSLMGTVWKTALIEWHLVKDNPWKDVKKPRAPEPRDRRVSDAERATIIKELAWDGVRTPDDIREWIAWSFCLALETMMRRGEILGMTWRHVYLDRRFVHLPKTKNGTKRNVPLSSAAIALFKILKPGADDERVVPVTTATFVAYFRIALADAEVQDMHFHDTRHEAITRNARKFKTVLDLSRASGHKSLQSIMRYVETTAEEMAEDLG